MRRFVATILLLLSVTTVGCSRTRAVVDDAAQSPARDAGPGANGDLVAFDPRPIDAEPKAEIEEMLAPYREKLEALNVVIGECAQDFKRTDPALGEWMADVTRAASGRLFGAPVDVAFVNSGGVRAGHERGPVTIASVMKVMPFDNTVVMFELDAEQMRKLVARLAEPQRYYFFQSGMTIVRSPKGEVLDARIAGEPITDGRTYRVATNSYLAGGGDDMQLLTTFPTPTDSKVFFRDIMIQHLRDGVGADRILAAPADSPRWRQEPTPE